MLLFAWGAIATIGCGSSSPPGTSGQLASAAPEGAGRGPEQIASGWLATPAPPLPERAEVVAVADALAVAATRAGPEDAARLRHVAARVRERSFRATHGEGDAREAIELYGAVAAGEGEDACEAARSAARLTGELGHDPVVAYREAFRAARLHDGTACARAIDAELALLVAFRPPRAVLDAIESGARDKRQELARVVVAPKDAAAAPVSSGVVVAPELEGASRPTKVVALEPYGSPDRARVVVTMSGATRFDVGELPAVERGSIDGGATRRGPRLFVDLHGARVAHARDVVVGGLVERVRLGARGDDVRLVLDLSQAAYRRVFYLPEPFRLVVDVATHPPPKVAAPSGSPRPIARVVLDPGHGGNDPGATGPTGLREKDVTLDVAHRAAPILARELGVMTMLTRDDDRYVPLDERAARANAFHADLFVSIHCNAAENPGARGVMTFVLDTTRDEVAARVAARENAVSEAASAQMGAVLSRLRLADVGARSSHFAELLQKTTVAALAPRFPETKDEGVKTAGFFVLVGAEMPSALFEVSFISNPTEEARLATADYRQKLADAIVNAVRAYKEGR